VSVLGSAISAATAISARVPLPCAGKLYGAVKPRGWLRELSPPERAPSGKALEELVRKWEEEFRELRKRSADWGFIER